MDPEKIHSFLIEADLPSTVMDLQYPNQEYVLSLMTEFLNKFFIDIATIKKPTPEQISDISLAEDCPEIISLINISEAMAGICSKIFLKDLCLTDLTNPMPKKTRRFARVLSNFLIYAIDKNTLLEERMGEMKQKCIQLENNINERNKYLERIREKASENGKKIQLKEQLQTEITRMRALKGGRKAKIAELNERLKTTGQKKIQVTEYHENLNTEAMKIHKMNEDLASKVVSSPERYESRVKELTEQKKSQAEKRELLQEAVMSKKPAFERLQSYLSIVSVAHAKFLETADTYKRLGQLEKVLAETNTKVDDMNNLFQQEAAMPSQDSSQAGDEQLQKTKDRCEQYLASIHNELTELLNKKKSLELKLANHQTRLQEIHSERDEIRLSIKKVENDTKDFVAYCQELYDKEINLERKLKDSLR